MLILKNSLSAWDTESFAKILKAELEAVDIANLPLQLGVSQAGMVADEAISVMVLSSDETDSLIEVKLGVFFTEIVINCGCGDDPMLINAHCELLISIDKISAATTAKIFPE